MGVGEPITYLGVKFPPKTPIGPHGGGPQGDMPISINNIVQIKD